jgi:hypothetical protein
MSPISDLELSGNFRCSTFMRTTEINDPAYWRQRAEEAQRLAEQLDDPVAKQTMQDIAKSYEQLAALAQQRRTADPGP